jgi:subtilase family serine protease
MVSAICPNCKILLVEATSNSFANLATAASYAASHADAVSNSYGGSEFSSETLLDPYYSHPGTVVTVSSGDGGYGAEYPAASPNVVAVGGTTLKGSIGGGWSETVWSGSGAGCSAVEPNPGWQPVTSQCSNRTVADVAADANPNTGVAVYDSYEEPGWLVFGGTSVSAPIVASVYALAENASTATARSLYGSSALRRVTEGTDLNPRRCGTSYLCNAAYSLSGWTDALEAEASGWYNGPTGNGTPSGLGAF